MGRVLGDYAVTPDVWDEMNHHSEDRQYMTLRTGEAVGWVYGAGEDAVTFTSDLKRAHSDADWAATMGREAIVVSLADMLRLDWSELPIMYDTRTED